jgi:signal transduction histidine kinase
MSRAARAALTIAGTYVLLASTWIVASDYLVARTLADPLVVIEASMAKGLLFVAVTGLLIYLLLSRELARLARLEAERLRATAERAAILDALPARVALVDRQGRILAVNSAWRRFAEDNGLDAPDAGIGLDYLATCDRATGPHSEEAAAVAAGLRAVLAGVRPNFELEYPCPSGGQERWFQLSVSATRWPDPEKLVVMHVDVSARHAALRAVQVEAEAQRALARVGHELIDAFNTPRLLTALCEVTAEVLGCTSCRTYLWDDRKQAFLPLAAAGHSVEEWEVLRTLQIAPDDLAHSLAELERAPVVQAELTEIFRPPLARPATAGDAGYRLLVLLAHDGQRIGILSATPRAPVPPLTGARRRIAQGIAQLASLALCNFGLFEELKRANRTKSDFVATISHELRTPLNVILGYANLLVDGAYGDLRAEQRDALVRVERNAKQLSELISDTLDLSRIEAGREDLTIEDVVLPELLAELEADMRDLRRGRDIELRHRISPDVGPLTTDRAKLKIILRNLVGNAFKFTERGSIVVSVTTLPGAVEFTVSDTGIGIAPDLLPVVFEPFRQGDGSSTRRYGGVGLGLYLVRRLVDGLGGQIAIESTVGVGTTFRVTIPQHRVGAALRVAS